MRILVCIKQVPDSEGFITIDESTGWIDRGRPRKPRLVGGVKGRNINKLFLTGKPRPVGGELHFEGSYRMNRFDEFALEEALRIREKMPVDSIDVLSVGPLRAESTIRKALEMGASRGIHIITEEMVDISAFETASLIASQSRKEGYDLILTGVMAEDDMQSQVGPMIAEMLGYPSASSVIYEEIDPERRTLFAEREIEAGKRECLEMKLPVLLTIQSGINRPRYPALSNVLRARNQEITTIPSHSLQKPEKRERIVTLRYPEALSKGIVLEGNGEAKAAELLQILHEKSII